MNASQISCAAYRRPYMFLYLDMPHTGSSLPDVTFFPYAADESTSRIAYSSYKNKALVSAVSIVYPLNPGTFKF